MANLNILKNVCCLTVSDEIIFGFTADQMKFCKNNEPHMWQYLVEKDLLFNTDQLTIRKLTGEAPFTGYFTKESPGRAAVWLGFRIVESYMMKNPGVKLEDLMINAMFRVCWKKQSIVLNKIIRNSIHDYQGQVSWLPTKSFFYCYSFNKFGNTSYNSHGTSGKGTL